jgi:hypothetical protein
MRARPGRWPDGAARNWRCGPGVGGGGVGRPGASRQRRSGGLIVGQIRRAPSPGPPPVCLAEPGCPRPQFCRSGTQVLGRCAGGRRPHILLLGLAQLRDSERERDQAADERQGGQARIAIRLLHQRECPRGGTQAVSSAGAWRNTAERRPGGAVVCVGGATERPAAGDPGSRMERIGCRPPRVGRPARIAPRAVPDVLRGVRRLPGGMPVDQFPLPHGQAVSGEASCPRLGTWQAAGGTFRAPGMRLPAAAELGQGEVGGELPAAVPDHPAVAAPVVRQADGIAGHLAGVLYRLRTKTPRTRAVRRTRVPSAPRPLLRRRAAAASPGAARPSRAELPAPPRRGPAAWRQCDPRVGSRGARAVPRPSGMPPVPGRSSSRR